MEQGTVKSHLLQQAEALAKDCTAFAESLRQKRDCQDVVMQIMQLAMMNKDVIHIFVRYSPHVDWFEVSVNAYDDSYEQPSKTELYTKCIGLNANSENDKSPLISLLETEDKLIELIAEAKDKAEVAA